MVLLLARDGVELRNLLRGLTHRLAGRRLRDRWSHGDEIPGSDPRQSFEPRGKRLRLRRENECFGKSLRVQDGNVREGFGAAGDRDIDVAERDLIRRVRYGLIR